MQWRVNWNDLNSDHNKILLTIIASIESNSLHSSFYQGPIKWGTFSEIMQNTTYLNNSLKTKEDIENATQDLVTSIQSFVLTSS
jgi:hypothetical protein